MEKKIGKVWMVVEGKYYHDGWFIKSVHTTKKNAEMRIRSDGFKLNKEDNLFLNENEQLWRCIESEDVVEFIK